MDGDQTNDSKDSHWQARLASADAFSTKTSSFVAMAKEPLLGTTESNYEQGADDEKLVIVEASEPQASAVTDDGANEQFNAGLDQHDGSAHADLEDNSRLSTDTGAVKGRIRRKTRFDRKLTPEERECLKRLNELESSSLSLRWANIDWLPHRLMHFLTTGRWMRGHGDPTDHTPTIQWAYFREEFLDGFKFMLMRELALGITLILIAQLSHAESFRDALGILSGGDKSSLTIMLYSASNSKPFRNSLYSLLALPFLWSTIRGIIGYRSGRDGVEQEQELNTALSNLRREISDLPTRTVWKHIWHDGLRWYLPLHPRSHDIRVLSRRLRWDSRIPPVVRHNIQTTFIELFERGYGYTKIAAGTEVVTTMDALNRRRNGPPTALELNVWLASSVKNEFSQGLVEGPTQSPQKGRRGAEEPNARGDKLRLLSNAEPLSDFPPNDDYNGNFDDNEDEVFAEEPASFEAKMKRRALLNVLAFSEWPEHRFPSASFPKRITLFVGFLYGRYLRWWIGLAPSRAESLAFWFLKTATLVYAGLFLRTFYLAVKSYINCPDKRGMTFTGEASWAGKFDEECLAATISQFNTFPGQSPEVFQELLPNFHVKTSDFALDLSNKGLNGRSIARILNIFADFNYVITSLNVSHNAIGQLDASPGAVSETVEFGNALGRLKNLVSLDLSYNYIGSGDATSTDGTKAIAAGIEQLSHLRYLNLSDNKIGAADDSASVMGTMAMGRAIGALNRTLVDLRLGNNRIGTNTANVYGVQAFAEGLGQLTSLIYLDVHGNRLGLWSNSNTIDASENLMEVLGLLTKLRSLDISGNDLGSEANGKIVEALSGAIAKLQSLEALNLDDNNLGAQTPSNSPAMVSLGNAIGQLSSLKSLSLAKNNYGDYDRTNPQGTAALGRGLSNLTSLVSLNLARNQLGSSDAQNPTGTVEIGRGLGQLGSTLLELDLSGNRLGSGALAGQHQGIVALADGLRTMSNLQVLNLEDNELGMGGTTNAEGLLQFLEALPSLTRLRSLRLARNNIGTGLTDTDHPVLTAWEQALQQMPALSDLTILPNPPSDAVRASFVRAVRGHRNKPHFPFVLAFESDVDLYFETVPVTQSSFNFSSLLSLDGTPASTAMIARLMSRLADYPVVSLDLSNNNIGANDESNPSETIALAEGLKKLTRLISLNLAHNQIGAGDTSRDQGTVALGNSLKELRSLKHLNLGHNAIARADWKSSLSRGASSIAQGIGSLVTLETLDLSWNEIGLLDYAYPRNTYEFAEAIGNLPVLKELYLGNNGIGSSDKRNPTGTKKLGESIGRLRSLVTLSLENNAIGTDAETEKIIIDGIVRLPSLCSLDVSGNQISSATSTLLQYLPKVRVFNIAGIKNILWTESADAMTKVLAQQLRAECENRVCFAKPIPRTNPQQICPVSTPFALRSVQDALTRVQDNNFNSLAPDVFMVGISALPVSNDRMERGSNHRVMLDNSAVLGLCIGVFISLLCFIMWIARRKPWCRART